MAGSIKIALELAELIKKENIEGKERLPASDTFLRVWSSNFSRPEEEIRKILLALRDCHFIFIVNIVAPDPNLFVYGEEAYIFTEVEIINDLKRQAEENLERLYESSNYKRKSAFQISRELFPKIKEYNNTPLGRAINVVVMLEEYNRIILSSSFEYTDQWRKNKLQDFYKDEEGAIEELAPSLVTSDPKRAVDSINEGTKEKIDPSWSKATQNFSVEFLLRVHFRKYEFDIIKKLIQTGKIKEEKELKFIRDTLILMETRTDVDRLLKRYQEDMTELRRYSQAKLNMLRQGINAKSN
ncbi:hypothetical protein EHQ58_11075 [Leptospira ognonensis]|uniref:Uncharacterized protein n=1 Tax=Leptospira ognonensis TaxID=2484945 RepID=A0A4R9JXK0_9LEPT|nr:hypothetical protein [Leptospira ognonensis]TGL57937.1 hypothetical protein EHQ58_11075 [Leptospira ognonensis]